MRFLIYITIGVSLLLMPVFALAEEAQPPQEGCTETGCKLVNPLNVDSIPSLIGNIVKAVLGVLGSVTLYMVVKGAVTWLQSGGNEEKIKQGAKTLMWAFLGAVVVMVSYILVDFMLQFLIPEVL